LTLRLARNSAAGIGCLRRVSRAIVRAPPSQPGRSWIAARRGRSIGEKPRLRNAPALFSLAPSGGEGWGEGGRRRHDAKVGRHRPAGRIPTTPNGAPYPASLPSAPARAVLTFHEIGSEFRTSHCRPRQAYPDHPPRYGVFRPLLRHVERTILTVHEFGSEFRISRRPDQEHPDDPSRHNACRQPRYRTMRHPHHRVVAPPGQARQQALAGCCRGSCGDHRICRCRPRQAYADDPSGRGIRPLATPPPGAPSSPPGRSPTGSSPAAGSGRLL
jgi:hypothetical protein